MLKVASHIIPIVNSVINSGLLDPETNQYELCLLISTLAFNGCKDRQGVPYVQHGLRLSNNPLVKDNELAQYVCLLHDVIEMSDLTANDLLTLKVDPIIVNNIIVLTHDKNILNYDEYIDNIIIHSRNESNNILLLVKIADMEDNSNVQRLPLNSNFDKTLNMFSKYIKNYPKLKLALKNEY